MYRCNICCFIVCLCYWNYTPPEAIWCTDEDYDQMVFENGLMFGDSFKTMTFTFYKQLQ